MGWVGRMVSVTFVSAAEYQARHIHCTERDCLKVSDCIGHGVFSTVSTAPFYADGSLVARGKQRGV